MKKNKIGIGSLSLLLFIVGCLFSFTFNDICIGDNILTYVGLKAWSNGNSGNHYTIFYSLLDHAFRSEEHTSELQSH